MEIFKKIMKQETVNMAFYITSVGKNCLYRDIEVRFFDAEAQSFVDISDTVAEKLQMKVKNGGVRIDGGGMNMAFALSQRIRKYVLEKYGKEIEIKDHIFIRNERNLHIEFMQRFIKENISR